MTLSTKSRIIVTGAAGLLGQNLITELVLQGFEDILAIDKDQVNLDILHKLHPQVKCLQADLSEKGSWEDEFKDKDILFLLQAQITGSTYEPFKKNTVTSTKNVIEAVKKYPVEFTVFVGSSVVNSVADDNYTRSKKAQEALISNSDLPHCVARPTLMFGWFDPKHLGWLSRFMEKVPVYPIPGNGEFLRQPLYARDFARILIKCAELQNNKAIYDVVGNEDVTYIDIIRKIKKVKGLHTIILKIPVWLFRLLLKTYALFVKNPPFVADQLDALMAGDYFKGVDVEKTFGMKLTPFEEALTETFTDPKFSKVVLERWK